MQTEKKLYDNEKEQVLLNCLLLEPSLMDMLAGFTKEYFYNAKHQYIYQKMNEQWKSNRYFDVASLTQNDKNIDPVYLATMTDKVPSPGVWKFYSHELSELYKRRLLQVFMQSSLQDLGNKPVADVVDTLQSQMSALSTNEIDSFDMKHLAITAVEEVQKASKENRLYTGFESGFENIDDIIDGFQKDNMYVIGARPSIGKTAFALAITMGLAMKGAKVSVFSLEMSAMSLYFRMISAKSDIPMWQIKKGIVNETPRMIERFRLANETLFSYPISIMDSGIDNDKFLYSRIRYEARVNHAEVIVIDHLGLIEVSDSSGQRYVDVGRITKTLHKMARELNVCIIVLAQCGREAEGKRPNLALLRESGNIEQDADVIMLLHRQRELDNEKERDNPMMSIPTDVIVAKNRDGKTGTATFSFKPICMKFTEDKARSALNDEGGYTRQKEKNDEIPF